MKTWKKNRLTDVGQLTQFSPLLLADFLRPYKGLGFAIPSEPTDKNMPYEAIRRACLRVDENTPPEFLFDTHLVSETAAPKQRERIEEYARDRNVVLRIPPDVTNHDFALLAFANHRELIEYALVYSLMMRQKRYAYYPPSMQPAGMCRQPTPAAIRELEAELDRVLQSRGYGIGARVMLEDYDDELWVLISRGERRAQVPTVADDGDRTVRVIRPENYDVLIVNKRHGFLKILDKPDNKGLHPFYRTYIGDLLYGSTTAFEERDCFFIEPFRSPDASLLSPGSITEIRSFSVNGISYGAPGAQRGTGRFTRVDVYQLMRDGFIIIPANERVRDVTVRIEFDDGAQIDAKVFDGNTATFSRDGAAYAIDELLIERGILRLRQIESNANAA